MKENGYYWCLVKGSTWEICHIYNGDVYPIGEESYNFSVVVGDPIKPQSIKID